jgi:hypothetical protein
MRSVRSAALFSAAAGLLGAAPALAQQQAPAAGPVLPPVVADCRNQQTQDIVVRGRRGERSPYRLPAQREGFDPDGPMPSVSRERHRLYEVGQTGIGSCSNVGPGGWTGCDFLRWEDEHHQRDGNGPVAIRVGADQRDVPPRP